MNCPFCEAPAQLIPTMATYRRGHREIQFETECWTCPNECPGFDSKDPITFYDPQQLRDNDDRALKIWRAAYAEAMPGSSFKRRTDA